MRVCEVLWLMSSVGAMYSPAPKELVVRNVSGDTIAADMSEQAMIDAVRSAL